MSISNLVTDLEKPWLNLQVNSVTCNTSTTDNLIAQNVNTTNIVSNNSEIIDQLVIPVKPSFPPSVEGGLVSVLDELYYANSVGWFQVFGGPMLTGTSNGTLINATTAEISLLPLTYVGSPTVGPNRFKTGATYHMVFAGTFSSQNANTLTLRGKINATTFVTFVIPLGTGVTGQHYEINIDFTIRSAGGPGVGNLALNIEMTYSDTTTTTFRGDRQTYVNNTTFDTTVSNTWDITAQFNTNSANNSMQTQLCYLTKISG
jgi:hypothetical protein